MDQKDKEEKLTQQEKYKLALELQMRNKTIWDSLGKMTQSEKEINKETLTLIEGDQVPKTINYMIPGLADNS
jgi:hypothetical protein